MAWIEAMWHSSRLRPQRILVAGCGTGNEAFALRRQFPDAEITAIDFSVCSIRLAKRLQQRFPERRRIRFIVADLTAGNFAEIVGNDYDVATCHGVLGDITQPQRALDNLANCLRSDGALYLGVNGSVHFSQRWRKSLPAFGFDAKDFKDGPRLRRVLMLHDTLTWGCPGVIAKEGSEYLASDLFGPIVDNRSLAAWVALCRRSDLHFLGSYGAHRSLRPAFTHDLFDLFVPQSRAEAHQITELIKPSAFHALVLARRPTPGIDWVDPSFLKRCLILGTNLYTRRWPTKFQPGDALRRTSLKSKATNTRVDLCVPGWVIEILRSSRARRSVHEILSRAGLPAPPSRLLTKHLYSLYLLGAINLHPGDPLSDPPRPLLKSRRSGRARD